MSGMRHPNCCALLGVCAVPAAIVTEFCERGSLTDVLQRAACDPSAAAELPWSRRLAMVRRHGAPGPARPPAPSVFPDVSRRRKSTRRAPLAPSRPAGHRRGAGHAVPAPPGRGAPRPQGAQPARRPGLARQGTCGWAAEGLAALGHACTSDPAHFPPLFVQRCRSATSTSGERMCSVPCVGPGHAAPMLTRSCALPGTPARSKVAEAGSRLTTAMDLNPRWLVSWAVRCWWAGREQALPSKAQGGRGAGTKPSPHPPVFLCPGARGAAGRPAHARI